MNSPSAITLNTVKPTFPLPMDCHDYCADDIEEILIDSTTLAARINELAEATAERHKDDPQELILVCVLKGAVLFLTDFVRALPMPSQMEFMAVSSYGAGHSSSGVVRILKDLDRDITGRDVVILEDIIDSGLTLSWLIRNLKARNPRSLEVVTLLRKPDACRIQIDCADVGFDIPNEFVVGYGLDYAEAYRELPYIGRLKPSVYGAE